MINKALAKEEDLLLQKSRIKWMQKGDGKNNFFFNQIKSNWNRNKVMAIENKKSTVVHDQSKIAQVALDHFQLFLGTKDSRPSHDLYALNLQRLTQGQVALFDRPIINYLILDILKSIKKGKAPRPNGFSVEFFLATWHIVGDCICKFVFYFFASSIMHKGINFTSIIHIPKVNALASIKDFRPMYLCTTVYKCISKFLLVGSRM